MEKIESSTVASPQWEGKPIRPVIPAVPKPGGEKPKKAQDGQVAQSVDFNEVVNNINEFTKTMSTDLSFSVDKESGRQVIIVKNRETGEMIRQIPPKEMIRLARTMKAMVGIIFHQEI